MVDRTDTVHSPKSGSDPVVARPTAGVGVPNLAHQLRQEISPVWEAPWQATAVETRASLAKMRPLGRDGGPAGRPAKGLQESEATVETCRRGR